MAITCGLTPLHSKSANKYDQSTIQAAGVLLLSKSPALLNIKHMLPGILEKKGWTHGTDSDSRDGLDLFIGADHE